MKHSTTRDVGDRTVNGMSRTTVQQVDDSKLMQEIGLDLFSGEQQETIEHVHPYGFSAVPLPPTKQTAQGSQSAQNQQQNNPSAEAFVGFMNGNRSHGVAFVVGDRRYRLMKMKGGEVALHDDQGQWAYFRRNGVLVKAPNGNSITLQIDEAQQPSNGKSGQQSFGQDATKIPISAASIVIDKGTVTINAGKIVLNGACYLGGADASLAAAMKGTLDTAGNADESNLATKVFVK